MFGNGRLHVMWAPFIGGDYNGTLRELKMFFLSFELDMCSKSGLKVFGNGRRHVMLAPFMGNAFIDTPSRAQNNFFKVSNQSMFEIRARSVQEWQATYHVGSLQDV